MQIQTKYDETGVNEWYLKILDCKFESVCS